MNKKLLYEVPETELFELRFEENILSFNGDGTEKPIDDGDEDF